MKENELIQLVKDFAKELSKTPTIASFSKKYNLNSSTIIKNFGSWNIILTKAGLNLNKSNKRTDKQLLLWIKTHPNAKYSEIPYGIRNGIDEKFGSISKAREQAGLAILDWRKLAKRKKRNVKNKAGRPIEFTTEIIVTGLQELANKLGRPPRMKDITKAKCGFPISAVLTRFSSFNEALQAAFLPPVYSHHEFKKLTKELENILVNIKFETKDLPKYYNLDINGERFTFIYDKYVESVFLKRSDLTIERLSNLISKLDGKSLKIYYLVDDSLFDDKTIVMKCIMDYVDCIDKAISDKIVDVRLKYDEINRKYIYNKIVKNVDDSEHNIFEEKGSSQ